MSDSIFGSREVGQPATSTEPPREVNKAKPFAPQLDQAKNAALLGILRAPLLLGESAQLGFARKENELREAFAALTVLESHAVRARLSNPRSDDELAVAFMRMTHERRARLISFLADARRREALGYSRARCNGA